MPKQKLYGDLFSRTASLDNLQQQFKRLAMRAHPDRGGTAEQFVELQQFYEQAISAIESNSVWLSSTALSFQDQVVEYQWTSNAEIGTIYSGSTSVVLVSNDNYADLTANAVTMSLAALQKISVAQGPASVIATKDLIPNFNLVHNTSAIVTEKSSDFHPLKLVVERYSLNPVDVAWMIGKLMHLMCFLEWADIVHGAIDIDNLWVDLDHHRIALYGGWWYSRPRGKKFIALPTRTAQFLGSSPIAEFDVDRDCVRATILKLFGAVSVGSLRMNRSIPSSVVDFLSSPFRKSGVEIYRDWENSRDRGFGARKFVKFDYQLDTLYNR